ncbi:hypothetical protein [Streptomyces cucumeris]
MNRFSQWIGFGNRGVIADNDPIEQKLDVDFTPLHEQDLTAAGLCQAA